jgi:hypothetical protein
MNLALKDGGVSLTVQLGTGKLDTAIKPGTVRFDDNAWHHVLVVRKSSEVLLINLMLLYYLRILILSFVGINQYSTLNFFFKSTYLFTSNYRGQFLCQSKSVRAKYPVIAYEWCKGVFIALRAGFRQAKITNEKSSRWLQRNKTNKHLKD